MNEGNTRNVSYKAIFGILIPIILMLIGSWAVQIQAQINESKAQMRIIDTKTEAIYELKADMSSVKTDVGWIKSELQKQTLKPTSSR